MVQLVYFKQMHRRKPDRFARDLLYSAALRFAASELDRW
jgi:hypothetical protein